MKMSEKSKSEFDVERRLEEERRRIEQIREQNRQRHIEEENRRMERLIREIESRMKMAKK